MEQEDAGKQFNFRLLALLVSLFVALPLLSTQYLTLFDYSNHVARYGMISRFQDSEVFRQFFSLNPKFIPNLGFDLLAVNLGKFLPVPLASQLIIFFSVFSSALGLIYLARKVQGKESWLAFIPPVFLWSFSLIYGFNNFVLAFAFVPWALLEFERYLEDSKFKSIAWYIVLTMLTFCCHAQIAGLTMAFAFILAVSRPDRKAARMALAFAPVLLLVPILAMTPSSGEFSKINIGSWKHKLRMLFQSFLTGSFKADLLFLLLLAGSTIYLFVSKQVEFSRRALWVVVGSAALYILTPSTLKIASNLDARVVPIAVALFFVFLKPLKLSPKAVWLIGALLFVRCGSMAWHLRSNSAVAEHVQEEFDKLPDNAVVFNTISDSNFVFTVNSWNPPILNLPYFGMWRRPVLISGMYTYPNQQPMIYSAEGEKLNFLGIRDVDQTQPHPDIQLEENLKGIEERMALVPAGFWSNHTPYIFLGLTTPVVPKLPSYIEVVHQEPKFLIAKIHSSKLLLQPELQAN